MKEISKSEKDLLYYNNRVRKSFQWEVWGLCNQKCTFCYLNMFNMAQNCTEEKQLSSLKELNEAIDHLDFEKYNNISLIGGEFFQGECRSEKVKQAFFDTCVRIGQLYKDRKIGSFWLTATLTRAKQDGLYELLNYFEDNDMLVPEPEYGASGLWLCTSWDAEGRFHNTMQKQYWQDHMRNLNDHYPWVKKATTVILTEPFLDEILNGSWDYKSFRDKFGTTLFFKPPGLPQDSVPYSAYMTEEEMKMGNQYKDDDLYLHCPEMFLNHQLKQRQYINEKFNMKFFPTREKVVEVLRYVHDTDREWYDRMFNIRFRADELHRNFKPEMHDELKPRDKTSRNQDPTAQSYKVLPCGHNFDYAAYIDSKDKCFLCDKLMTEESEG